MSGSSDDIIANDNAIGPAVVTIVGTDAGFMSARCAPWVLVTGAARPVADAPIGDGTWVVGVDIAPGLWKTESTSACYWERSKAFGGGIGSIIANENARGTAAVQIAPSDKAFTTKRCGTWTKAG